jgi:Ser/Thr protein kinase RdoA (MazF antagonist)
MERLEVSQKTIIMLFNSWDNAYKSIIARDKLRAQIDKLTRGALEHSALGFLIGDFNPGNVFFDGEAGVTIIDI